MQNKTELRWSKPELKVVGTLRDVAGNGIAGPQSSGQGAGNSKS